ncbi:dienelactone hydrolase family protein [Amycolatopsis sp. NPDC059657]|uniref:dienelactone hydrolase family protein n=1 Tax=Amycolatopsis sp. NPDC059657 TaxID=3346899 RepID=UPI00366AC44B
MTVDKATVRVGDLSAYLARPGGGSVSGMLLLPMITGIGQQLRDWADELAEQGVTALVWDTWHGSNADNTPQEKLFELLGTQDDEQCLGEQRALLDHLFGELGCTRAGVIGWCLGGRFALLLGARDDRVSNVVAYHPTIYPELPPHHVLDAVAEVPAITAPAMVLYPTADELVPRSVYVRLRDALESRPAGATIAHVYPEAEHGFSNRSRHANPVNASAYAVSWPQVLAFVKATT